MKKYVILGGLALLVLMPVALKLLHGGEIKEVQIEAVSKRTLAPSILASGSLTYQTEVNLVSEVMGRVQEILVKEGDQVRKGQLLLRLDPATSQAQVAQLQAALQQSRLNIERQSVAAATLDARWKRYEKLRAQGMVDANLADDIRSQRDLAQVELQSSEQARRQTGAQLEQAREQLAKTEFRAPLDGRVTALIIKVGETAVPSVTSIAGSNLLTVADTSNLYAEVNVNETDVAHVMVGQQTKIVPAAFPNTSWIGTVESVAVSPRQVAGQSKSYPVKVRLTPSADMQFHTGMSCRAEISTQGSGATPTIAVPVQAVRYEESTDKNEPSKASVIVIRDGRANVQAVETGASDDAYIEITKGIAAGEQVATGPSRVLRFLRAGDRIKQAPLNAAAATAKS